MIWRQSIHEGQFKINLISFNWSNFLYIISQFSFKYNKDSGLNIKKYNLGQRLIIKKNVKTEFLAIKKKQLYTLRSSKILKKITCL